MHSQRGFTLVEVLIALALALPMGFALLGIASAGIRAASTAAANAAAGRTMLETVERLDAEAHSAAAIFTPSSDVLGGGNCSANGDCREVDFFTRDKHGLAHFWAYRYDAGAQTLQRYAYDDLTSNGPVNLRAGGIALTGMRGFSARRIPISQIGIPALPNFAARDVVVPFAYPGVSGGNAIVAVDLRTAAFALHHDLLPRLTATGFTVVVGTYAPPPVVPSPPPSPANGILGQVRSYIAWTQWRIGPCVNAPLGQGGCGRDGDDSGLLAEQNGADAGPGGTLVAPPDSQLSATDACATTLGGVRDANGTAYASVSVLATGGSEFWLAQDGATYVYPTPPLRPNSGSFAPVIRSGPGFEYITTYRVAC